MAEDAGRLCDLPFAHNLAARVAAFRGQWDLASAHVSSAEQAARAAGTPARAAFAAAARGVLGLARDDPAEVLRRRRRRCGPAVGDPTTGLWRPARIWALIRPGWLDEAAAELDAFEADAAGCGDRAALVHGARLRASVALARGEPEQAEAVLEAGRALADGLRTSIARALFDVEYGRCLARAHRRPAALARLRSAHEDLAGLGARPFADAVAAELAALGLRGRPDRECGLAGLTAQERQVARLVAGGMSNREAAARLYLSPKTIEYHLAHIFAKLGIKTRYQLAARGGAGAGALGGAVRGGPGRRTVEGWAAARAGPETRRQAGRAAAGPPFRASARRARVSRRPAGSGSPRRHTRPRAATGTPPPGANPEDRDPGQRHPGRRDPQRDQRGPQRDQGGQRRTRQRGIRQGRIRQRRIRQGRIRQGRIASAASASAASASAASGTAAPDQARQRRSGRSNLASQIAAGARTTASAAIQAGRSAHHPAEPIGGLGQHAGRDTGPRRPSRPAPCATGRRSAPGR